VLSDNAQQAQMQDQFSEQVEQWSLVVDDLEQQLEARIKAEQAAAAAQASVAEAVAVTPALLPLATQCTDDFAAPDSSNSEDTYTDTDSVLASKHYETCYVNFIVWVNVSALRVLCV
jgi:hypothetical protein